MFKFTAEKLTHEGLPERKQMTIAVGLLAQDGIVIAADAQESSGDYMKGAKGKIACWYTDTSGGLAGSVDTCAIAGAGNSGYVQALTNELGNTFIAHPRHPVHYFPAPSEDKSPKKFPKDSLDFQFKECLKIFYKEHIIPFSSFPDRSRPELEMLIAVQRRHILGLFTTEKTVVNRATPYKAIGWGSTFAELFLGKLWRGMTIEQAEVLAAYVVFLTKESVENCGKFTTIASIRSAKIVEGVAGEGSRMLPTEGGAFVSREKIENWEKSFRDKWWRAEQDNVYALIDEELPKP